MSGTRLVNAADVAPTRIFGADRTYFVLHGDSTADRMVIFWCLGTADVIGLDDGFVHPSARMRERARLLL